MAAHHRFSQTIKGLAWAAVGAGMLELGERASIAEPAATTDTSDFAGVLPACTGLIRCHAVAHVHPSGDVIALAAPAGLGAQDLQNAYKVNPNTATTSTIALVEAYNDPTLEADLATYRQTYNLPPCTVANGCLTIVNQSGQTSPLPPSPPATDDWTIAISMDAEIASAMCPKCKILVVEAQDDMTVTSFLVAQNIAAQLGATVIVQDWTMTETGNNVTQYETYLDHPGVTSFASSSVYGFNAYLDTTGFAGPQYPGTSSHVISVGATSLSRASNSRGWTETAWASGGSSCSATIAKPAHQANSGCAFKAANDVAVVGDTNTPLAVYHGAWGTYGGGMIAVAAGIFAATNTGYAVDGSFVASHSAMFYDLTSGSNGTCPTQTLCQAGAGWDGPTGFGAPNGTQLVTVGGMGSGSGSGSGAGSGSGSGSGGAGDGEGTGAGDALGACNAGAGGAGGAILCVVAFAVLRRRQR